MKFPLLPCAAFIPGLFADATNAEESLYHRIPPALVVSQQSPRAVIVTEHARSKCILKAVSCAYNKAVLVYHFHHTVIDIAKK